MKRLQLKHFEYRNSRVAFKNMNQCYNILKNEYLLSRRLSIILYFSLFAPAPFPSLARTPFAPLSSPDEIFYRATHSQNTLQTVIENMDDEDVEERETDGDKLLSVSENLELQSLAVTRNASNRWTALGYLQCCKCGQLFNPNKHP